MMEPLNPEVAILNAALELPAEQRAAYLDRVCADNPALLQKVEALLHAHQQARDFLEAPLPGLDLTRTQVVNVPLTEKPGDRIARYKLLQQIGEGGCGVVYMAEQEEPVRRRVALKVIKLGMDTKEVIARFDAERQALAMMDHPNIAKVLDAGATDTGRPYFVMELVRGIKITEYCDQNNLSTRERLDLFTQVCQAIQHAHQKGIIHRDIKPSNVLVMVNDGVPVPKVIDFGIAKATEGGLTDKTLFTAFEQFIGTPAYMSPEQAVMTSLDIDTRSDIYSLGVLLYELLTGTTPFDAKELLAAGFDEMRRTIRDKEPVRPSTRLSAMVQGELTTTAQRRHTDPPKLIHMVRGDLDWIVMRCLEKDRTRRYETANGLATDIQRHLNNEPVVARPPSSLYRFQKLVRRNKLAFAAAGVVAFALLFGLFTTQRQAVRARKAERAQSRLRQQAELARGGEARERATAEQRLYDSLVREARVTRIARRVGYREQVFALLHQARALDVPQKNLAELRREATSCLGEFVGLPTTTFAGFPAGTTISKVRMDPTGRAAVFLLSDGTIVFRDVAYGKEVTRLKAEEPAWDFCFDSKGERLATVHLASVDFPDPSLFVERLGSATVRAWVREADGQWVKASKAAMPGAFKCLSTSERLLVAVRNADAGTLDLLDAQDNSLVHRIPYSNRLWSWSPTPVLSPDAQWLAVPARRQSQIEIWNLNSNERMALLEPEHPFFSIEFSRSGKYLAAGDSIYATNGFRHVTTLAYQSAIGLNLSFDAGEKLALPLLHQTRVWIRDLSRNADLAFLDLPFSPHKVEFSDNGRWLLASGLSEARLFPMDCRAEKLELPGHTGAATAACFSPDGSRVATVGKDQTLKVCDAMSGRLVWEGESLPGQGGQAMCYSPDGRFIATGHWASEKFWLWHAQTGARLLELQTGARSNHVGYMCSVQFSPDGRNMLTSQLIADVTNPEGLAVWSLNSLSSQKPVAEITRKLNGGSRQLIYLSGKREAVTLDVATGRMLSSFPTLEPKFSGTAAPGPNLYLSPDGAKLAVSSASRLGVDIWNPKDGRLVYSLPEQNATILWLRWSPDNQCLAVTRSDGEVAIWNLREVEHVLIKLGLKDPQ